MELIGKAAKLLTEELWEKGLLPCYFTMEDAEKEMKYMYGCNIDANNLDISPMSMAKVMHNINFDHIWQCEFENDIYLVFGYKIEREIEIEGYTISSIDPKYSLLGMGNAINELWRIKDKFSDVEYEKIISTLKKD